MQYVYGVFPVAQNINNGNKYGQRKERKTNFEHNLTDVKHKEKHCNVRENHPHPCLIACEFVGGVERKEIQPLRRWKFDLIVATFDTGLYWGDSFHDCWLEVFSADTERVLVLLAWGGPGNTTMLFLPCCLFPSFLLCYLKRKKMMRRAV